MESLDQQLSAYYLCHRLYQSGAPEAYLARHGEPQQVADLARHSLLGFTQPESLNQWPLRAANGERLTITPALSASSGETLRHLALQGEGIVQLADFMTREDCRQGRLVPVLAELTETETQPIHAVYYRNTQLVARITCFLDYISEQMAHDWL